MPRPIDLPDFTEPPLNEVALGVQFSPIPGYSAVDARDIWELFRSEYPRIEERPPLPPQFETFGGSGGFPSMQFQFNQALPPMRLLFVSERGDNLLQFQPDRFLMNWRQSDGAASYPRYEKISQLFEAGIKKLIEYIHSSKNHDLDINQIEISYINIIPVDDISNQDKWLKLWPSVSLPLEMLNANFTEVVHGDDEKPLARLHHALQSMISIDGKAKAIRFDMSYRGKPDTPNIDDALNLLGKGRIAIVKRFTDLTTDDAHRAWGRTI